MLESHDLKSCSAAIANFVQEVQNSGLDAEQIIDALLTPMEIEAIFQRLAILDALARGVSQRDISESLGVGIATVTRGSRTLQNHAGVLKLLFPRKAFENMQLSKNKSQRGTARKLKKD